MNHSTKSASTTRVAYSLIGLLLLAQALLSVAPRETVGQENLSFSELAVRNIDPVEAKAQISRIMGDSVEVIADREGRRLLLRGVGVDSNFPQHPRSHRQAEWTCRTN